MRLVTRAFLSISLLAAISLFVRAEMIVTAEDDASESGYNGGWSNGKNGGNGFSKWTLTNEGNDANRHSGFFIASTKDNSDLNGIAKNNKAFGTYANGSGFEQAIAYRAFEKPLQPGDSFSFMMETGPFEKKFENDDPSPASVGVVIRSSNANSSVADYNKDALFEFGHYQDKGTYQVYDGSGADKADTGVPFTDMGVSVTVTVTGPGTYDLEIETMGDKKITKLPGRKFSKSAAPASFALFNRNAEKNDAFFNQFQIARETNAH